jgi:hypothetical protein
MGILWLTTMEEAVMTLKIPLRLRGIDLRDVDAYARIDPDLEDLSWEANGGVSLAVLYSDDSLPVADATDWARRITKLMPGVTVADVHDELVSISDIAVRAGVAPETARLWAAGKRRASLRPFPAPRQVVGSESGGKSMSLYAWREVVSWIRDVIGIDPDVGIDYLSDSQHANLNADLAGIALTAAWHPFDVETPQITGGLHASHGGSMRTVGTSNSGLPGRVMVTGHHGTLRIALK